MRVTIALPSPRWIVPTLALICIVCGVTFSMGQTDAGSPGVAASSSSQKIAVVDLVRIFNECAQIKDLNDMIRQKNEDYTREAGQRKRVIEDKQTELSAFKPGTPDFETRKKNVIRMNIEANVWVKVTEQEVDQMKFDWTRVVYEKAMIAVNEIAKERNYHLVLQKNEFKPFEIEQNIQTLRRVIQDRGVLFHTPDVEITENVIQRMNASYKAAGGKATLVATSQPTGP